MSLSAAAGDRRPVYHGILNLDKPAGWTSHDVVGWVRKTLGQRSAGHAGTLDPMATGVLLVCLGQATRVVEYLMDSQKVYRAVVRLGATTDTYDSTGAVTASAAVPALTVPELERALAPFIGEIEQIPPAYSAIKQNGVAAYRKARRGEAVALPARPVTIYRIDVLDWQAPDLTVEVTCGAGTYIRSLAHDLGQALGCGAHLAALTRLRSGRFSLEQAASLDDLAAAAAGGEVGRYLQPIEAALAGLVPVPVDDETAARLAHGLPIAGPGGPGEPGGPASPPAVPAGETGYARTAGGRVVAILGYRGGQWWPRKVFAPDDAAAP